MTCVLHLISNVLLYDLNSAEENVFRQVLITHQLCTLIQLFSSVLDHVRCTMNYISDLQLCANHPPCIQGLHKVILFFWEVLHQKQILTFTRILTMTLPERPILQSFPCLLCLCERLVTQFSCCVMAIISLKPLRRCKNHDYRQQRQTVKRIIMNKHLTNLP